MELKESRLFKMLNGNWVTNVPLNSFFFPLLPINAFGRCLVFSFIFIYFPSVCETLLWPKLGIAFDGFFFNKQLLTARRPVTSEFKCAFLCQRLQMLNVSKSMFR